MKTFFAFLFALLLLCLFQVEAGQTILIGGTTAVNGTSNSISLNIGNVYPPRGTFGFANGGVITTNVLTINVQLSVDNTNFLTVATYNPTSTNSVGITNTSEAFTPSYSGIPIYLRAQVITTGGTNVSVGGSYSQ